MLLTLFFAPKRIIASSCDHPSAARIIAYAESEIDTLFVVRGEKGGSLGKIIGECREKGAVVKEVDKKKLDFMCGHSNHQGVAAICAAPSVLGVNGILEGKNAVCYPGYEDKLLGANVLKEEVAVDGNVITSRGLGTAIPFSLEIVKYLLDEEKSEEIRKKIIFKL